MKPYPLTDKDSIELMMMGSVKAEFPSPAEDVWGIGRRMMRKQEAMGVKTAWDYANLPETTVRMLFHLPGYWTWKELKGLPCIALEGCRDFYRPGYGYKKAGVVITKLVQEEGFAHSLFSDMAALEKESRLSESIRLHPQDVRPRRDQEEPGPPESALHDPLERYPQDFREIAVAISSPPEPPIRTGPSMSPPTLS